MSEQLTEPFSNNQENNIQLPEPFPNNPEENKQLIEPSPNNPEDNQQFPKIEEAFINNQEINQQFQKLPEPFISNQEENQQLQEPFRNNQEDNQQLSKQMPDQLPESLTNNQENNQHDLVAINQEPPSIRSQPLLVWAIFILVIDSIMNFIFVFSDILASGFYDPDKEMEAHVGSMLKFGMPCAFISYMIFVCVWTINSPIISLILNIILILIKTGLFTGYFIHLYGCRHDKAKIRLLTIIFEISFDFLIIINEILKIKKKKKQSNN